MKYNLRKIMLKARSIYRKNSGLSFGECLHRAWLSAKAEEVNEQRIEAAKGAAVFRRRQIPGTAGNSWAMK